MTAGVKNFVLKAFKTRLFIKAQGCRGVYLYIAMANAFESPRVQEQSFDREFWPQCSKSMGLAWRKSSNYQGERVLVRQFQCCFPQMDWQRDNMLFAISVCFNVVCQHVPNWNPAKRLATCWHLFMPTRGNQGRQIMRKQAFRITIGVDMCGLRPPPR